MSNDNELYSVPRQHILNNYDTERVRLMAERTELMQERARLAARGDEYNAMKADPNFGAARLSFIYNNDRSGLDAIAANMRAAKNQAEALKAQTAMNEAMAARAERSTAEGNVAAYSDKLADQKNTVDIARLELDDAIANYPEGSVERKKAQTAFDYELKKYKNLLAKLNDYETRANVTKTISDFDEPELNTDGANVGAETVAVEPSAPTPTLEQEDNAFVANVPNLKDSELVEIPIAASDDVSTQQSKSKRNAAIKAEKEKRKADAKARKQKAAEAALKAEQSKFDTWRKSKTPNQLKIMSAAKQLEAAGIDPTKYELGADGTLKRKGE